MASQRKLIREALTNLLKANPPAGVSVTSVFSNRVEAYHSDELPSVSVFTDDETATPRDTTNQRYRRALNVRVEIRTEVIGSMDDSFDEIADSVETTFLAQQGIAQAQGIRLLSTETGIAGETSQTAIGICTLSFEIAYTK